MALAQQMGNGGLIQVGFSPFNSWESRAGSTSFAAASSAIRWTARRGSGRRSRTCSATRRRCAAGEGGGRRELHSRVDPRAAGQGRGGFRPRDAAGPGVGPGDRCADRLPADAERRRRERTGCVHPARSRQQHSRHRWHRSARSCTPANAAGAAPGGAPPRKQRLGGGTHKLPVAPGVRRPPSGGLLYKPPAQQGVGRQTKAIPRGELAPANGTQRRAGTGGGLGVGHRAGRRHVHPRINYDTVSAAVATSRGYRHG